jgi:WD40 repeat protein
MKIGASDVRFDRDDGSLLTVTGLRSFSRWPAAVDAGGGRWVFGPPQVLRDNVSKAAALSRNGRWFGSLTGKEYFVEKVGKSGRAACLRDEDVVWFDVSPNGRWIATTGGMYSRKIKVWDAGSGQVVHVIPSAPLGRMEFSPDGRRLATASAGHAAQLWQVGSWRLEREWENAGGVTFNPDGTILAITQVGDARITLLDVARGAELATLIAQEESPIFDLRFSLDGDMLAAACPRSRMLQVWDLRALRSCLKDINLDWEQPEYSPPAPTDAAAMAPVEVRVLPPPLAPEK